MKLINNTPARKNITIEFTPHEQDMLKTIVGSIIGPSTNPVRSMADDLWPILKGVGAVSHTDYLKTVMEVSSKA